MSKALKKAINADSLMCVRLGSEFVARINYLTLALSCERSETSLIIGQVNAKKNEILRFAMTV